MAKLNSSKSRVTPVFDMLRGRDPTGATWLPVLLDLGSRKDACRLPAFSPLGADHPAWWGKNERRLRPPTSLLRWLVQNLKPPERDSEWGSGEVRAKRELLVARDPDTIAEALRMLESTPRARAWYVLEGASAPDAMLETETFVLVIEGRHTEAAATTTTTWMSRRSQILRHMDSAYEVAGARTVLGLMIVEECDEDPFPPTKHWLDEAASQVSGDLIEASLPHRPATVQQQLIDGFLGVTTWRAIAARCGLSWPPGS
jgi:hypothetical protein